MTERTGIPRGALVLLAAIAVATGLATAGSARAKGPPPASAAASAPSPAIYPPERRTVAFEHRTHGARLGLACADCHPNATTSARAEDLLLPFGTACDRCHATDHRDRTRVRPGPAEQRGRCQDCHQVLEGTPSQVARQLYPRPNLHFDHRAHARRNIGCGQCHGELSSGAVEGRLALPSMRRCARCHLAAGAPRGEASANCDTCHLTRGGVLRTRFPSGVLLPPRWLGNARHGPAFAERHAAAAGADSRFCANCHRESECADCHDGRTRPRRLHPNDWLNLHGRAAEIGSPRCTSCHHEQSFCLTCHQRLGVSETAPSSAAASRGRFHPPPSVWTDAPRTRGHHAWAAQKNLVSCVSCHVERDCVTCHATAARGGAGAGIGHRANPHGTGFARRCGPPYRMNPRPCWVCHDPDDPELAACD